MATTVNQCSVAVESMAEEWSVIDALMGGTRAMRKSNLLPQWPAEEAAAYAARQRVSTLFPAYKRTIGVMSAKPFSKPLTLDKAPPQILEWSEDIDKEGVNLHTFCAEMFSITLAWGFAGILVEAPKPIPPANGIAPTQAEQKQAGVRPYFVRVRPKQFLGWRTRLVNGTRVLTQLRLAELDEEDEGDYGTKEVIRVRVLTPGAWEVYEQRQVGSEKKWMLADAGQTGLAFIPFVPLYGQRLGFMCGAAPLVDLAYLNVKHYQSQSDQDTILHVARVPMLFAKCFGDEEVIQVGASIATKASSKDADLQYVEHTGSAIEAGQKSIEALEEQMVAIGAEFITAKPGPRTATEDANDNEGNKSDLQRSAEGFEDSIDLALSYMAAYSKLGKGGTATLYKDFSAATLSDASAQIVLAMNTSGLLTKVTALKEQQRRGVVSSDIDPEKEVAAAAEEGPEPGTTPDPG